MRYLVAADIHANLEAFEAVIRDAASTGGFDQIVCLGDVVGYGPNPRQCIELLRWHPFLCIAGNHDRAAVGMADIARFNHSARSAIEWTASQLAEADRAFLSGLDDTAEAGDLTLVHGSPRDPIWEYITSATQAAENLGVFATSFCLVGHTHFPRVFRCTPGESGCEVRFCSV